ncbi:MAG TPA: PRC-barrel domain-containing protein [Longimicrobiales bacterium]
MGLTPLSTDQSYTFPEGAFDVRGWEVRTMADEDVVGAVADLLIAEDGTIAYLDVDVAAGGHVLVPLGRARVDAEAELVWVPGMTREQLEAVPEYPGEAGAVTAEYEARVEAAYAGVPGNGRGGAERAELPTGVAAAERERLASLGELEGFDVADEEPDPRGWEVLAADGRGVGSVRELVVDTEAMKVRYLDCAVDEEALGLDRERRHILIPIGFVRLDEADEKVLVDAITSADVKNLATRGGLPPARRGAPTWGRTGRERREASRARRRREDEVRFFAPRRRDGGAGSRERGA